MSNEKQRIQQLIADAIYNNEPLADVVHEFVEREKREAINKYIKPHLDMTEARGQGRWCKTCGVRELRKEQE